MTTTTRIWLVAITAWLTALFPARVAGWLLTLYATHGGTLTAALNMAQPSLEVTFLYVAAGVLYLRTPALRGVILFGALDAWLHPLPGGPQPVAQHADRRLGNV